MKVLFVAVATYMASSYHLFEVVEANQLNENESSNTNSLNRKRTAPLAENMKPFDAIPQPILLSKEEEVFMRLVQEQNSFSFDFAPSTFPSSLPSSKFSLSPSAKPSPSLSAKPSTAPSASPTKAPVVPDTPTSSPTTGAPSPSPSKKPTPVPLPTTSPTKFPSKTPTLNDKCTKSSKNCDKTPKPTDSPTASPSFSPVKPTSKPSSSPTHHPSSKPSTRPTSSPSYKPSSKPSCFPTITPTKSFSPTLSIVCKDSGTKMLLKRDGITKKRNCSWVAQNENKRALRCSLKEVASHCPNACNSVTTPNSCEEYACQDSMMEWVRWGFEEALNCDWVKVNPERRCAMNGVKATCRQTCAYANDFLTCPSAPSAHPSVHPSSAPVV